MRILLGLSAASVLCACTVLLFAGFHVVNGRRLEAGGALFELMIVAPTIAGFVVALAGMVAGAFTVARRSQRSWDVVLMTAGHTTTWIMAVGTVVWALAWGTSGWELLLLPVALLPGQCLVAAGIIGRASAGRPARA